MVSRLFLLEACLASLIFGLTCPEKCRLRPSRPNRVTCKMLQSLASILAVSAFVAMMSISIKSSVSALFPAALRVLFLVHICLTTGLMSWNGPCWNMTTG